jgi:hypothetical protein
MKAMFGSMCSHQKATTASQTLYKRHLRDVLVKHTETSKAVQRGHVPVSASIDDIPYPAPPRCRRIHPAYTTQALPFWAAHRSGVFQLVRGICKPQRQLLLPHLHLPHAQHHPDPEPRLIRRKLELYPLKLAPSPQEGHEVGRPE